MVQFGGLLVTPDHADAANVCPGITQELFPGKTKPTEAGSLLRTVEYSLELSAHESRDADPRQNLR